AAERDSASRGSVPICSPEGGGVSFLNMACLQKAEAGCFFAGERVGRFFPCIMISANGKVSCVPDVVAARGSAGRIAGIGGRSGVLAGLVGLLVLLARATLPAAGAGALVGTGIVAAAGFLHAQVVLHMLDAGTLFHAILGGALFPPAGDMAVQ